MTASGSMTLPVIALVLLIAVILLLLMVIWSIKRHRDPHLRIECDDPLEKLLPTLCGLTHGELLEGNAVEILENGAFFEVMLEEIRSATKTVHFEMFLWKEGELGRRMAEALAERARAGVQVRVLLDATGTKEMGKAAEKKMKAAGCKVVKFHHRHIRNLGVMNERDHRKLVVLDGRLAFVCGHCIVDTWLGNGEDKKHFRDMGVRLLGPIVHQVQSIFSENWIEETGELFAGDDVFPPLEPAGKIAVHAASVKPEGSAPAVKILHHMVLCVARKRLWIQNPYFLPEPDAIDAFAEAVKRGVDVRVMTPSAEASDNPIVQHAAHRNFHRLLDAGVRLFEYPITLMHQKTMTVDGVWCAIGSTNFDDRAFEINDELTLGFKDAGLAKHLEEIFERDMKECVELDRKEWAKRGIWHRVKDNVLYLLNEQL